MRLGISSYAYTWAIGVPGYPVKDPMTPFHLLEKATELGVSCVQIADNLPLHLLKPSELTKLEEQADSRHIGIEIGTRGLQPDNFYRYLDIASQFQSPILRIVIDAVNFEPAIPDVVALLQHYVPYLEKYKIKLAIENHDRFKAKEFLQIINAVQSEWIGICLDSVNSLGAGEGVHLVTEALGPYTINFHVKEFFIRRIDHKMGFVVEGKPAGQGMLPLQWMLGKISKQCNSAILEQWVPPEDGIEATIVKEAHWARSSVQYLKSYFI